MATVGKRAVLPADVRTVWNAVTDFRAYDWRSDLCKTEPFGGNSFAEYAKNGAKTVFTVTASEPYKRWELHMENDKMRGHWTGTFTERGAETEVVFTETVTAKNLFLKPFVRPYLKKQQQRFVADLAAALRCVPR